jgi:hypothetical protein
LLHSVDERRCAPDFTLANQGVNFCRSEAAGDALHESCISCMHDGDYSHTWIPLGQIALKLQLLEKGICTGVCMVPRFCEVMRFNSGFLNLCYDSRFLSFHHLISKLMSFVRFKNPLASLYKATTTRSAFSCHAYVYPVTILSKYYLTHLHIGCRNSNLWQTSTAATCPGIVRLDAMASITGTNQMMNALVYEDNCFLVIVYTGTLITILYKKVDSFRTIQLSLEIRMTNWLLNTCYVKSQLPWYI